MVFIFINEDKNENIRRSQTYSTKLDVYYIESTIRDKMDLIKEEECVKVKILFQVIDMFAYIYYNYCTITYIGL